jgi:hypothetical protein
MHNFQYKLDGAWYTYFFHDFNCGHANSKRTERTVELALADYWLNKVENVCEVGAVSPYYWPNRIHEIVDPGDKHPQVTSKVSLFDCNFRNRNVLSISTVEHVGTGEYGISETRTAGEAITKIVNESSKCLITVPLGWNSFLDHFLRSDNLNLLDCTIAFLIRHSNDTWSPVEKYNAFIQYGGGGNFSAWANSLAIIEKGNILT